MDFKNALFKVIEETVHSVKSNYIEPYLNKIEKLDLEKNKEKALMQLLLTGIMRITI